MNNRQDDLECSWSSFQTQVAQQGACTNSAVRQLWIEARVQEMRNGKEPAERMNKSGSTITETVKRTRQEHLNNEGKKLSLSGKLMRRVSLSASQFSKVPSDETGSKECSTNSSNSTKASTASNSTTRKRMQSSGASFQGLKQYRRSGFIDPTGFQDKDLRASLAGEPVQNEKKKSFAHMATQWQQRRRRASTDGISQSINHHFGNASRRNSTRSQQRRQSSSSTRRTEERSPRHDTNLYPMSVSGNPKFGAAPINRKADGLLHVKDRNTTKKNKRASASCSVASHEDSTIDDELPPDDTSESSTMGFVTDRRGPTTVVDGSDEEDNDSVSLCEFFKEQLHATGSVRRTSSVCSDIQSELGEAEEEHGSCSSKLFRPYVAGNGGGGFMNMSATSLDFHDNEFDSVTEDFLSKKSPGQPMRRAGDSMLVHSVVG